jgi:hypothetical protein
MKSCNSHSVIMKLINSLLYLERMIKKTTVKINVLGW